MISVTETMVAAAMDEAGSGWGSHLAGDARRALMRAAIEAALRVPAGPGIPSVADAAPFDRAFLIRPKGSVGDGGWTVSREPPTGPALDEVDCVETVPLSAHVAVEFRLAQAEAAVRSEEDIRNATWESAVCAAETIAVNHEQDARTPEGRDAIAGAAGAIVEAMREHGPTGWLDVQMKGAEHALEAERLAASARRELRDEKAYSQKVYAAAAEALGPVARLARAYANLDGTATVARADTIDGEVRFTVDDLRAVAGAEEALRWQKLK